METSGYALTVSPRVGLVASCSDAAASRAEAANGDASPYVGLVVSCRCGVKG